MKFSDIIYKTKTATEQEIFMHLMECDNDFPLPPFSKRINLEEYSRKLFERSVTFEAWSNRRLIGLIAAYFNNIKESSAFITNTSVVGDYKNHGIASHLMSDCILYSQNAQITFIFLEVNEANIAAISFYRKFGFIDLGNNDKILTMKLIVPVQDVI